MKLCKNICIIEKKIVTLHTKLNLTTQKHTMNAFLKNLGVIILLIGFLCLVVYKVAVPANGLLVCSLVLEFVGILAYIIINKKLQ